MTRVEFENKVLNIFKRLDYQIINSLNNIGNDYIIEKETIIFTVRIKFFENKNEIVDDYEIDNFYYDLTNHYKNKGYLITNTFFNSQYENEINIKNGKIRLFNINEITRLNVKLLN
jgi:hypothetical protein